MTRHDDFTAQLEAYLDEYERSTPLPEDVRDAIRAQVPSMHQRPAWWPARRFPEMNQAMRIALASAAVLAVALVGFSVLRGQSVGDPDGGDPTPTAGSIEPNAPIPALIRDGDLEAGSYSIPVGGIQVTLTVPDGWTGHSGYAVVKNLGEPAEMDLGIFLVDQAYTDPCRWNGAVPDLHPGYEVQDLATGLANQELRGDALPTDITVDGFAGQLVELTVPPDIDLANCDGAEFRSWDGRYHQGPGQHDSVYILDVNGVRLVIDAAYLPGTSSMDRAELQGILDSIQIDP